MSKRKVNIIIDVHEPAEITGVVDRHEDVEDYSFDDLPAADLEIDGIGFERKTVSDYASSLTGGRIDDQTRKLAQRYEIAYILIDGDMSETDNPFQSDIKGESLRGSWAALTAREDSGVRAVIPCSNTSLLVDEAIRLARKHFEESDREFIPSPDIDDPEASVALQCYACLPGVGPKMAKKLEERWPTLAEFIAHADYESLQEIEGIGHERALKIIESIST